jgi:hypothetical protein
MIRYGLIVCVILPFSTQGYTALTAGKAVQQAE